MSAALDSFNTQTRRAWPAIATRDRKLRDRKLGHRDVPDCSYQCNSPVTRTNIPDRKVRQPHFAAYTGLVQVANGLSSLPCLTKRPCHARDQAAYAHPSSKHWSAESLQLSRRESMRLITVIQSDHLSNSTAIPASS